MSRDTGSLAAAAGDPAYRLPASVEPFVDRRGHLRLVRAGAPDLMVPSPDARVVAAVDALAVAWHSDGTLLRAVTRAGLQVQPSELRELLDALDSAGLLITGEHGAALDGEDADRFARQLPYLAELGDAVAIQRKLRCSRVTIIGCGGLGSWAAAAIACLGIGQLVLVDDDQVALGNLNRQILFAPSAVGRLKIEVAREWLNAFDPVAQIDVVGRRVRSPAEVSAVIAGSESVVLAADWPPYDLARWVNAACVDARIPFVMAGQVPPILKLGPTYVPGDGPCFACHEQALRELSDSYDDYVEHRRRTRSAATTLGPASGAVGSLMAVEVLHLLAGTRPATQGAAVLIDMRTLEARREEVERRPDCLACQHLG